MDLSAQSRSSATWLCRSDDERGRMQDMIRRLRRAELVAIGGFAIFALAAVPTTGWGLIAATATGALFYVVAISRSSRSHRPELVSLSIVAAAELALMCGILLSSGPRVMLISLLAAPMMIGATVWPTRGVIAGVLATSLSMLGLAFAVDASAVLAVPAIAMTPIAVLASTAIVISAARAADVDSRSAAAVDRLTGLLNRAALLPRAAELSHQAELLRQPVALLIGDVDHFKEINDSEGHEAGDSVLIGIATRLRQALGSSGSLYRFGGEELVVLSPGASAAEAAQLGERLRQAVAGEAIARLPVTLSFGVAASAADQRFDFELLFGEADAALYEAKAQGRNRVCCAQPKSGTATRGRPRAADVNADAGAASAIGAGAKRPAGPSGGGHRGGSEAPGGAERARGAATKPWFQRSSGTGNWLAPDEPSRVHMMDLINRLRGVRIVAYAILMATIAAVAPYAGWWVLLPPIPGLLLVQIAILNSKRARHPEVQIVVALLLSYVGNASSELVARNQPFFTLPLLVAPLIAWAPVFPRRAVIVGAFFQCALIAGAGIALGAGKALSDPLLLGVPLCLLVAATAIGTELGRSASHHRTAAVVDPLTGMLNRLALESQVAAIGHEVTLSPEPVALIVGDVDHFKLINDSGGHATGDLVLREIAYRIRKHLRAFEAAYRIGGEEFVVLLKGVDSSHAHEVAERIREVIEGEPIEELPVTMSFGVASFSGESSFDYERLFAAADACLYEAKRGGRNRVCLAKPEAASAAASPEGTQARVGQRVAVAGFEH